MQPHHHHQPPPNIQQQQPPINPNNNNNQNQYQQSPYFRPNPSNNNIYQQKATTPTFINNTNNNQQIQPQPPYYPYQQTTTPQPGFVYGPYPVQGIVTNNNYVYPNNNTNFTNYPPVMMMQPQQPQPQQPSPNNYNMNPPQAQQPSSTTSSSSGGSSSRRVMAKTLGSFILLKEKLIGSGAYADVYEGYHRDTKEKVAIKVIQRNKLNDRLMRNLESEITLMKRIQSDYVIKLYEVHRSKRHYYLIVELCSGGELGKLLKKGKLPKSVTTIDGGMKESIAKKFIYHLSKGMKQILDQNLIHRDLKPANLLLSKPFQILEPNKSDLTYKDVDFGFLKIADFGFAREIGPNDLAQTLCGTPLYMAPEILSSQRYNYKADLWSLGAIIYELLFGRPPYMAVNQMDLLNQIRARPPPYPNNPTVYPPLVIDLIKGLLQADPNVRFTFEQFYNHPYLVALRKEFGDNEEFNSQTLNPAQEEYIENPNVVANNNMMTDVAPFSNTTNDDTSKSDEKNDINDDEDEDKLATPANGKTAGEPISTLTGTKTTVALDSNGSSGNTSQDKNISSDNEPTTTNNVSEKDNNMTDQGAKVLIMDKQISPNEALYNNEYQLEKVIGCSNDICFPSIIFDFSALVCSDKCLQSLKTIENLATRAWFIAETAFIMEKTSKYAEAYGIYIKAGVILRQAYDTINHLEEESERSGALRSFIKTVMRDVFQRALVIDQEKLNSSMSSSQSSQNEISVDQILYMYAIRIAQEAAYKEYLNSSQCTKECLAMYIRAKYIFEYLVEISEEYSQKVELRNFLEKFTERINYLEKLD
ncbi:hypothetical protein FDP41_009818 [Naegleria fowleri]|uniref:Protein kinase domain-containing protein n=1 Tax=Naegleria fowleri TaxID=5763 RepID=A0A6A5BAM0_NAEFO|nr:uncharacterized protein FDP41_009818 [Naegleria fowleri]KAF0972122.1 hypothetical protein FDP41_009818 [Naegleria fowleri]